MCTLSGFYIAHDYCYATKEKRKKVLLIKCDSRVCVSTLLASDNKMSIILFSVLLNFFYMEIYLIFFGTQAHDELR